MIKVYIAEEYNEDARGSYLIGYFLNEADAKAVIPKNGNQDWGSVLEIEVWEKGEYSVEALKRKKALAKLTKEEREILGL